MRGALGEVRSLGAFANEAVPTGRIRGHPDLSTRPKRRGLGTEPYVPAFAHTRRFGGGSISGRRRAYAGLWERLNLWKHSRMGLCRRGRIRGHTALSTRPKRRGLGTEPYVPAFAHTR